MPVLTLAHAALEGPDSSAQGVHPPQQQATGEQTQCQERADDDEKSAHRLPGRFAQPCAVSGASVEPWSWSLPLVEGSTTTVT